jgi:hypothetical protein
MAEGVDEPTAAAERLILRRRDPFRAESDSSAVQLVHVRNIDNQNHGRATQIRRTPSPSHLGHLWPFLGDHDHGAADLYLGMGDASVVICHARKFHRAKSVAVEIQSLRGPLTFSIGVPTGIDFLSFDIEPVVYSQTPARARIVFG